MVVVAVQHGGDGRHVLGKQRQVQLGAATLDHADEGRRGVDAPLGPIDVLAVMAPLLGVALIALALGSVLEHLPDFA